MNLNLTLPFRERGGSLHGALRNYAHQKEGNATRSGIRAPGLRVTTEVTLH